jgi:RES domain
MPSKRTCPRAPRSLKGSLPQTETIPAGTILARFRGRPSDPARSYPANSFNPNLGKDWTLPKHGARFNPFPNATGSNVPSIYVAATYAAAALESVFHDVPHVADPEIPRTQVEAWQRVELKAVRELRVVMLTNPQLRQLPVRGRKESLREDELIHTPRPQYPKTRTWAKYLYDHIPDLDGLAWRPRLGGEGVAYVFFGGRCDASDFQIVGPVVDLSSPTEYARIKAVADGANITIINGS